MLFGTALIVGGGRFVGPRAALLAHQVRRLFIVESEKDFIERYAPIEPSDGKMCLTVVHEDVRHYTPPYGLTSLFYDPFPRPEGGERIAQDVNVRGRLLFITGIHQIEDFPGKWELEYEVDPMFCADHVASYRKLSE